MKFKFNDFEIELDNTDVDFLEKYSKEAQKFGEAAATMKSLLESGDAVGVLKAGCKAVDTFFNSLFGKNTSEKMFRGRRSYKERFRAVIELNRAINDPSELDEMNAELIALIAPPKSEA